MKAVVYRQFKGPIALEEVPDPQVSEGGVVLKVGASGLCRSDWHGWMGHDTDIKLPHVPGHELAGTVVEVGRDVRNWKIGKRVTVPFVGGCGSCVYCTEGNQQVCDHQFQPGFTAWGSFAEYVAIDYADENLVELPPDIGMVEAASLGCRFITAFRAVKDQGQLQPEQWLAVHGCGGVGLSAVQIGKALGAKVIAVDVNDEKCEMAKRLGADHSINASRESVVEIIKDLSHGGVHVSTDALGHTETCLNSIHSLRKRGKHIQIGLMTDSHANPAIPIPLVIANELEILGSHGMQAHKYPEMFRLIQHRDIDLHSMITDVISMEQVPQQLSIMGNFTSTGVMVMSGSS